MLILSSTFSTLPEQNMTSFAKACIDFSNNIKNLRFYKLSPKESRDSASIDRTVIDVLTTTDYKRPDHKATIDHDNGYGHEDNRKSRHQNNTESKTMSVKQSKASTAQSNGRSSTEVKRESSLPNTQSPDGDSRNPAMTRYDTLVGQWNHTNTEIPTVTCSSESRLQSTSPVIPHDPNYNLTNQSDEEQLTGGEFQPRTNSSVSPMVARRIASLARHSSSASNRPNQRCLADTVNQYTPLSACSSPLASRRNVLPSGVTIAEIKQRLVAQGMKLELANGGGSNLTRSRLTQRIKSPVRRRRNRYEQYLANAMVSRKVDSIWSNDRLMTAILGNLSGADLLRSCTVNRQWFQLCKVNGFWDRVTLTQNMSKLVTTTIDEFRRCGNGVASSPSALHQQRIIHGLRVGIKRNLRRLSIRQLTDGQASLLLNALLLTLYEDDDDSANSSTATTPSDVSSASASDKPNGNLQSNAGFNRSQAKCSDVIGQLTSSLSTSELASPKSLIDQSNLIAVDCNHASDQDADVTSKLMPLSPTLNGLDHHQSSERRRGVVLCYPTDNDPSSLVTPPVPALGWLGRPVHSFTSLSIINSSISDRNLEQLCRVLPNLIRLDLVSCNSLTDLAYWSALPSSLTSLTLFDCINVSDESMSAIGQLLPNLSSLTLQTYHVSDVGLSYFGPKQRTNLRQLNLLQCMELDQVGLRNCVTALTGLTRLSLSGCSSLTNAGLQSVCEQLASSLVSLDLSWCHRLTNVGLQHVSLWLTKLNKLSIDRCPLIGDIGLGYLTGNQTIQLLSLRWCSSITDAGIAHILSMTELSKLFLTGCNLITENGFLQLARHPSLRRLELMHCSGASGRVRLYLSEQLTTCQFIS